MFPGNTVVTSKICQFIKPKQSTLCRVRVKCFNWFELILQFQCIQRLFSSFTTQWKLSHSSFVHFNLHLLIKLQVLIIDLYLLQSFPKLHRITLLRNHRKHPRRCIISITFNICIIQPNTFRNMITSSCHTNTRHLPIV